MYFDFIEEKHLNKFVSIYFDYNDDILTNLAVKTREHANDKITADVFLKNIEDRTLSYLGRLMIDDFFCTYTIFKANNINNDIFKYNKNNIQIIYSQEWRKFMTKVLLKKMGEEKAEEYVETIYSSNIGNLKEYEELMKIVTCPAQDNQFQKHEKKGKE